MGNVDFYLKLNINLYVAYLIRYLIPLVLEILPLHKALLETITKVMSEIQNVHIIMIRIYRCSCFTLLTMMKMSMSSCSINQPTIWLYVVNL